MGQQVCFQVRALIKASAADGAFVRRLFHVKDLVDRQGPRLAESLSTFCALKGFLFGMYVPATKKVKLSARYF